MPRAPHVTQRSRTITAAPAAPMISRAAFPGSVSPRAVWRGAMFSGAAIARTIVVIIIIIIIIVAISIMAAMMMPTGAVMPWWPAIRPIVTFPVGQGVAASDYEHRDQ